MAVRQNAALHLAPLSIRVALGLIFLYYGAGKVFFDDFELSMEQEAALVSMGVLEARPGGPQPPAPIDAEGDTRSAPTSFELIRVQDGGEDIAPAEIGETGEGSEPAAEEPEEVEAAPEEAVAAAADTASDDFEPRSVRRLYGLAFPINAAAQRGHWPDFASSGVWLRGLAWAAGVTEFVGGFFILLGGFTRLWAMSIVGTMVVACFLTQISPWIGEPNAYLGLLPPWPLDIKPDDDPPSWVKNYQTLFFQLIIAAAAMTVFLSGPGAFSVDRLIFGGGSRKSSTQQGAEPG